MSPRPIPFAVPPDAWPLAEQLVEPVALTEALHRAHVGKQRRARLVPCEEGLLVVTLASASPEGPLGGIAGRA